MLWNSGIEEAGLWLQAEQIQACYCCHTGKGREGMGDAVKLPLLLLVRAGGQGATGREREGGSQWPGDLSGACAKGPAGSGRRSVPGGGPAHPAAGQGRWPGSLPGSPGCCACRLCGWCTRAVSGYGGTAREVWRVSPHDVQLGAEADPARAACVAMPGFVTHGIMPRKLHHRIARKGTAIFTKHEPKQAPDMLITALGSQQETGEQRKSS